MDIGKGAGLTAIALERREGGGSSAEYQPGLPIWGQGMEPGFAANTAKTGEMPKPAMAMVKPACKSIY